MHAWLPRLSSFDQISESEAETERAVTVQTCLLAIDNMTAAFAGKLSMPDAFVDLTPVVITYVRFFSSID